MDARLEQALDMMRGALDILDKSSEVAVAARLSDAVESLSGTMMRATRTYPTLAFSREG